MDFLGSAKIATDNGFERVISKYQAQNCDGCPMRGICHKSKGNRIIEVSHRLNELKSRARARLLSEHGIAHRKKRPIEVEAVFGMLKQNMGFRRFMLKGLDKVSIEFGLLAMAHNLKKLAKMADLRPFFNAVCNLLGDPIRWKISFKRRSVLPV